MRLCHLSIPPVHVSGLLSFYSSVGSEHSECTLGLISCSDFCAYGGLLVTLECNAKCPKPRVNHLDSLGSFQSGLEVKTLSSASCVQPYP